MPNMKKITNIGIGDYRYWSSNILWFSKINKANLDTDWVRISRIKDSLEFSFFILKFIDLRTNKDTR
jgi:hypothetical protein